ncbi:MAG: condensation domain-containing protein [Gemmatimonadota bacterium]
MSGVVPVPRSSPLKELPLSRAQESMWFLCRLAQDSTVYNLPAAVRLRGPLDIPSLRASFEAIVARHEVLRTVFPGADGKPRQEVRSTIDLPLELVDCSDLPGEKAEARVRELARGAGRRPFDLAGGPLFRLVLYRLSDQEHVLLTVFHHLVWDGWSIGVFVTELAAQYEAARRGEKATLPELPVQYADFALWERAWLDQKLESRLRYWRAALRGHAALELPPDRRRPPVQSYEGRTLPIQLPADVASAAERVSRDAETTPYMTLLAGFAALLLRWSGQERFTLGTPVANRHHREVAPLIGFFANLLPVPLDLGGDPSFAEVLKRTKASTTGAFAHQDLPFDALVEGLGAGGDPSRNPILQVMFALHQESLDTIRLGDVAVEPVALESDTTHFDLALHLWRRAGGVHGYFAYNSDLYDPSTVAHLGRSLITLLGAALDAPDAPLSTLPLLGDAERSWLHSIQDVRDVEVQDTVVDALARQAVARRDRGVRSGAGSTSLADLSARAEALASTLVERGVGPGTRLGLVVEDPATLIAATWGAWLTQSVPVPLDPETPDPLQREILLEANARLIIRDGEGGVPVVGSMDEVGAPSLPPPGVAEAVPSRAQPMDGPGLDDVAYLSGAADPPVEVTHRQLAQRIQRLQDRVPLGPDDAVFGLSGAAPDTFILGWIWPLAVGSALATAPDEATVLVATPGDLKRFLAGKPTRPARLRTLLCSGSYLEAELAERARALLGCRVVYLYSPPEAGAEVGIERIEAGVDGASLARVGQPILPTHLLDENGALVPVGAPGRVWVGERPTRDRGRWREDGALELLGPMAGWLWRGGSRHRLDRVRRAVLSDRSVLSCHVIARGDDLCAYVVTSGMAPAARIARSVPLPASLRPKVLPVSHLPFDSDGRVDEAALVRLPIVDEDLAGAWEEAIRTRAGAENARVVVRDVEQERSHVHLDDLVPGWRRRRTADSTSSTDHAELAPSFSDPVPPSSYCRGEELLIPEGAPATLVEALQQVAARWGDERGLTVYETATDETFVSYAELLDRARRVAAGLHAHGLRGGGRIILQIERLADHFVALWGCVLAGVAPVAVAQAPSYEDENAVLTKLWNTWTLLGEPPILASSSLCEPLRAAGALFGSRWEAIPFDDLGAHATVEGAPAADPEDVVFIQLTSGSTGVPKAVPETHRAVISHVLGARQMNDYTESDVSLNWLSLDHVVPLLTCHLKDTYLGLPQIHVRTQAVLTDPLLWLDLIERHRVTLSWAPNFAFKLVNDALARAGSRSWDLSSLRWVMNAGEQVTLPVSSPGARACRHHLRRRGPPHPRRGAADRDRAGRDAARIRDREGPGPRRGDDARLHQQPGRQHRGLRRRRVVRHGGSRLHPWRALEHHRAHEGDDHRPRGKLLLLRDRGSRQQHAGCALHVRRRVRHG